MKAFETWVFARVRFLAAPCDAGQMIIDEQGRAYGSWGTVDRFRERQQAGEDIAKPLLTDKTTMISFRYV